MLEDNPNGDGPERRGPHYTDEYDIVDALGGPRPRGG